MVAILAWTILALFWVATIAIAGNAFMTWLGDLAVRNYQLHQMRRRWERDGYIPFTDARPATEAQRQARAASHQAG
jgi:hypothetical protein